MILGSLLLAMAHAFGNMPLWAVFIMAAWLGLIARPPENS